jgi:hypothetical protein
MIAGGQWPFDQQSVARICVSWMDMDMYLFPRTSVWYIGLACWLPVAGKWHDARKPQPSTTRFQRIYFACLSGHGGRDSFSHTRTATKMTQKPKSPKAQTGGLTIHQNNNRRMVVCQHNAGTIAASHPSFGHRGRPGRYVCWVVGLEGFGKVSVCAGSGTSS